MNDYSWITDEMFYDKLEDKVYENSRTLLDIPGIYEIVSEYFNNEILEELEEERNN